MRKSRLWIIAACLLLAGMAWTWPDQSQVTVSPLQSALGVAGQYEGERDDGSYFTIFSEQGTILDKTVRMVYPGDELIAEDNQLYRVTRIEGDTAYAEFVRDERITWQEGWGQVPVMTGDSAPVQAQVQTQAQAQAQGQAEGQGKTGLNNLITMYSTHSAESYVPTDGSESIPAKGGIYKVGDQLARKLQSLGVRVIYDKRPSEPRDANAYRRSRRIAAQLVVKHPAAMIDLHRDGVPDPDFYSANVNGTEATKIRLVVGRQNQNMEANLNLAKSIKAYNDKINPGLVRGIFIGRGNYNQDLSPRSILVEAGTYTNSRLKAERGVELLARSLPPVLGIAAGPAGQAAKVPSSRGDWIGLYWVLAVLVIGGAAFLLISTGSVRAAMDKIKSFPSTEMRGLLGNMRMGPARKPGADKREGDDEGH